MCAAARKRIREREEVYTSLSTLLALDIILWNSCWQVSRPLLLRSHQIQWWWACIIRSWADKSWRLHTRTRFSRIGNSLDESTQTRIKIFSERRRRQAVWCHQVPVPLSSLIGKQKNGLKVRDNLNNKYNYLDSELSVKGYNGCYMPLTERPGRKCLYRKSKRVTVVTRFGHTQLILWTIITSMLISLYIYSSVNGNKKKPSPFSTSSSSSSLLVSLFKC